MDVPFLHMYLLRRRLIIIRWQNRLSTYSNISGSSVQFTHYFTHPQRPDKTSRSKICTKNTNQNTTQNNKVENFLSSLNRDFSQFETWVIFLMTVKCANQQNLWFQLCMKFFHSGIFIKIKCAQLTWIDLNCVVQEKETNEILTTVKSKNLRISLVRLWKENLLNAATNVRRNKIITHWHSSTLNSIFVHF